MADESDQQVQEQPTERGSKPSPPRRGRSPSKEEPEATSEATSPDASIPDAQDSGSAGAEPPPAPRIPPPPGSSAPPPQPPLQPVVNVTTPVPKVEVTTPTPQVQVIAPPPRRPTFFEWLGRVVGWLIAAIFGLLVGAALLIVYPSVTGRSLLPFAGADSAEVAALEADVERLQTELSELQAEQDAALAEAMQQAEQRLEALESANAEQQAALSGLESKVEEQVTALGGLEDALDAYAAQIEALSQQLEALQTELPGAAEYGELSRQLLLMRAWQEVLRARIRLMENNAGQAAIELETALGTLRQVRALSSPEQQATIDSVIRRLESVRSSLSTGNPFVVASDLEIAWYELGQLITPPGGPVPLGVTPTATPAETVTPASESQATPTP